MKITKQLMVCALLALLLVPAAVFGQEQAPERGMVEFGFRGVTGTVDGRTHPGDVPFSNGFNSNLFAPDVVNSSLNTYNDYRTGFYVPRFNMHMDDFLGTKSYLNLQSASNGIAFNGLGNLNRDQSFLATFGNYGLYKVQFRWDETPHDFSGTTRTLFAGAGKGVWKVDPSLQSTLFNVVKGINPTIGALNYAVNSAVAGTLIPGVSGAQLFTQQEIRKTGTGLASWNITPNWSASTLFSRENQIGTRPLGMIMGSGPSSYWVEIPEPIDYFTTNIKVSTEFGKKTWDAMLGYQVSLFQNNIASALVDNPFSFSSPALTLVQIQGIPSGAGAFTGAGNPTGLMSLYPDNKYQQFVSAGAVDVGKHIRIMANVTPGIMNQDAPFQAITTNALIDLTPAAGQPNLPLNSLHGQVNTLAMNYTAVYQAMKNLQLVAKYQQYDYSNHTPEIEVRDVVGDTSFFGSGGTNDCHVYAGLQGYCPTEQSSFHRKTMDLSGTWFLTKKNSAKVGYQREWMQRENRNVDMSIENSLYAATDLNLRKNLALRLAARHQSRMPQDYDYTADSIAIKDPYLRYADESTRLRNRGDVSLQWNATEKLNLSAFGGTLQDNYNVRNAVNSLTSLGDLSHSPGGSITAARPVPYYAYGLLNNIGTNFGFDANYVLTKNIVVFAEYVREYNRSRTVEGKNKGSLPYGPALALTGIGQFCQLNSAGYWTAGSCDPVNDLNVYAKDVVNTYFAGADITLAKKLNVSVYYSLSASHSNINADGANCQIGNGPNSYCRLHYTNWTLDTVANPAVTFNYPENANRIHEVGAIAKFHLTKNVLPKLQYTYRQYTNVDWQTGVVNPYSFVGPGIDPNNNSAMAKMLALGADTPSYKAHIISATLEYHF